jgi:hypothetical protein
MWETDTILYKENALAWQKEKGQPATGFTRLVTDWLPLCMSDGMAFRSVLLASEISRRNILGDSPW